MIEIEIDGKKVEVPAGSLVMDAANKLGTYIPHFCYHKKLSIAANCRMCLVEVEKAPKPLPACATPVSAGMVVHTHSEKAVKAQKSVMEFLLINHPLDCPICDQGGECQLQDLAVGYGPSASRYAEEKRVVFNKDAGPLISMEEMTRCIHCTRCVRFGQEIAGVMELGMLGRGEHAQITSFVGKTVDSELSGNMIDLCPVGALTSKPFRYSARTWELSRRKSISPHDSLGSNLIVQVKNNKVMRVLPLENDEINECWLSDKDRFSYQGLNSEDRLTRPMIKQGGEWLETDWQTALEYIAQGLKNIKQDHGSDALAALVTPNSTLEEMYLLQKIMRGLGSDNIDFRLRQADFTLGNHVVPWLGMSIAELSQVKRLFIVGSFFRKDHPLLSARVRQNIKNGAQLNILNAVDEDLLMPVANQVVKAPSEWLQVLQEIISAIGSAKKIAVPEGFEKITPSPVSVAIATSLMEGETKAVMLGNAAAQHPQASKLHVAAQWIAQNTDARFGYLTEAANTVGGYLAKANSVNGSNARQMIDVPRKAYVLLNVEPALDCANSLSALAAINNAEMVIMMSAYKTGLEYADVLLPISPFTETSGTFINCEGRIQSFNGAVKPLGETRPAWKVLRVLGNVLALPGFDYDTSESIRNEILAENNGSPNNCSSLLNNFSDARPMLEEVSGPHILERIADVPIYLTDAVVRRAASLQKTNDAKPPKAWLASVALQKFGLTKGDSIVVTQGQGSAILDLGVDDGLPHNVLRVAVGHGSTSALGAMFGEIMIEKHNVEPAA